MSQLQPEEPRGTQVQGHRVLLRPLLEADWPVLHAWRSDPESLYLWAHPRRLVSFPEYASTLEQSLRHEVDVWLMILRRADQAPVGFVYSYDTSPWDGFTFLCMFLAGSSRSQGLGREAGALFVRYLMDYFPLRKLYVDVYAFNRLSNLFVEDYGFVEEGCFRAHRYYAGRHWDMRRLALYRERWDELKDGLFTHLEETA